MSGLKLKIISPKGIILDTEVTWARFPGEMGPFTVLEGHAPLIASLIKGNIVYENEGQEHPIPINSGFAEIADDEIHICID